LNQQLKAIIVQMHQAGISFDEAVREFRKQFVTTVLRENKGNQCKARSPASTALKHFAQRDSRTPH
jgi:hypothetical protein